MADNDNSSTDLKKYKPHFKWKKYWREALVFILDAALLFLACLIVFAFARYVVFQGRIDTSMFNGENWVAIVGHLAWPVVVFLTIFLLRNPLRQILYEAEGIVGRSYVQQEGPVYVRDADGNTSPIGGNDVESQESGRLRAQVMQFMETQYDTYISRKQTLKGGRYFFDGAVKLNDSTYFFAIKHCDDPDKPQYCSREEIDDVIRKVRSVFACATPQLRQSFVFVVCIVTRKVGESYAKEMRDYVRKLDDFRLRFRFFEYGFSNNNLKEVFVP